MRGSRVYVCDSTALIDLYQHFPKKFKKLKTPVSNSFVKIPEGVYRELVRKTDKLRKMVEIWSSKYDFEISIKHDRRLLNELPRIDRTYGYKVTVGGKDYPGFWSSPSGSKSANAQVVTVGKVLGYIVVSDDRAVRYACLLENVECIG
ncbi:MAG: hypothetical protein A2Y94_07470 [Caldithrix sp. RBG_13_44_9]|nr:MAG: hypothetical protein A2Y94_07470 [Caldithrix sp. RBG_13_44_9]